MSSLPLSALVDIRRYTEKSKILHWIKRAIFPVFIGTLVLSGLLFSSTVAYFIFYWSYIPSVAIVRDVHLQFSRDAPPWGSVDIANTAMLNSQPYAAFVELELPRTKNNLEIGNFMVSLTLLNSVNSTLATSSRPAILTYSSPLISTSLTVLNSPLLITGFKKESETLLVRVMERFEFTSSSSARPRWANIEIIPENNKIQVYSTKVMFVAQFEGVRWFMYSHRIIAFMLFTSLFFISSSLFAGLTWFIFYLHSSRTSPSPDDLHNGAITTRPSEEKPSRTELDDDLTISPAVSSRPGLTSYSSSGTVSQTYPPVTQLSTKEEYRQALKHGHRAESSTSGRSREEDVGSVTTQVKSDDDTASGYDDDEDIETIEGHPISEMTF